MSDIAPPSVLGPPYPFPPITEAIVEYRFETTVGLAARQKIGSKLAAYYPNEQLQVARGVKVDLDSSTAEFEDSGRRVRRSNQDENEILLLGEQSFAVSQLGVYPSWDHFHKRIERDWSVWKKVAGYEKITQIGMRFINRIDVPIDEDGKARHEDYLTLRIELPEAYPDTAGYAIMAHLPLEKLKAIAHINSGTIVPSPVPKFGAFLLDIDIVRMVDVPQKDADIENLLLEMREEKNRLFESFITDAARERFFHDHSIRQSGT